MKPTSHYTLQPTSGSHSTTHLVYSHRTILVFRSHPKTHLFRSNPTISSLTHFSWLHPTFPDHTLQTSSSGHTLPYLVTSYDALLPVTFSISQSHPTTLVVWSHPATLVFWSHPTIPSSAHTLPFPVTPYTPLLWSHPTFSCHTLQLPPLVTP